MAGSIFGLGLSQRVNSNGKPDMGWLLFLYEADTSTPVTAYKDTGLTAGLELPWPIEADSSGMMPSFWLADGSYRARATSKDGSRIFFDLPNVLALGPSSGEGGGGGGVDPNAIFQTGDPMFLEVSGTRAGWVRDNARTIGSATSGATERANSDCQSLFGFYWNNFDDTACPVVGGRGANAAADWAANKQITTLDKRGVGAIGLDDMGNSAASRFTNVPFTTGDATTAASICGENAHVLTKAELPATPPTGIMPVTNVMAQDNSSGLGVGFSAPGSNVAQPGSITAYNTAQFQVLHVPQTNLTMDNLGSGTGHSSVSRSITGTWYRKL